MLNGVYTPELSASIGKRQQFFHWKTPGAGSDIADSLTVEGNFRVPATRQATNKMADASISDRNLRSKYRTFAMLFRCTDCTTIRFYTTKIDRQLFLRRDIDFVSPRRLNEESPRSSAFYRNPPPRGREGVPVSQLQRWRSSVSSSREGVPVFPFSPGSPSAHRLSLKDDFRHWNEWEKSSSRGIPTFSAEMAGAKAL